MNVTVVLLKDGTILAVLKGIKYLKDMPQITDKFDVSLHPMKLHKTVKEFVNTDMPKYKQFEKPSS